MRLLAFLTSIEACLRSSDLLDSSEACARFVDYRRGSARMVIGADQALTLAHYRLASGRSCLRVNFDRGGSTSPVKTFYPEAEDFFWPEAAEDVAQALAGFLRLDDLDSSRADVVNA